MPYRHLHIWLLLLFPLILLAFLPNYFLVFGSAAWPFHVHAATASAWIALLAFQSWSIHRRRNGWHRVAGIASLAVFPLFLGGAALVMQSMAAKFATGTDPFYNPFGSWLAAIDLVAMIAVGWFYWEGLRTRRIVQLHARWMTATILFLLAPIFARLIGLFVPGLTIRGPEDFGNFPISVQVAHGIVLAIALWLARSAGASKRPLLASAALVAVQAIVFEAVRGFAPWEAAMVALAGVPPGAVFAAGLSVGAVLAWLGWSAVPARVRPVAAA